MTNPQDAGPHPRDAVPAPGTGSPADEAALPDKPILEWTEDDWARWIAGPPPPPPAPPDPPPPAPPTSPDEDPGPGPSPEAGGEIWVELDATGEMDVGTEMDTDAGDEAAAEAPDAADEAAAEAPGEAATVVGPEPAVEPVPPDEGQAGPAEREWWEAVPPPLPPPSRPGGVDGRVEAGPQAPARALGEPADVAPAAPHPALPPSPARAGPGRAPAPGAPGTRARPAPPRAQPVVIERSHRVRSALGLLGVAVLVGAIVAGLITVAIFAIGVALRRAVG